VPRSKSVAVANQNYAGIIVQGSLSTQKFRQAEGIISDCVKHVLTIQLLGELESVPVVKPVLVTHKPRGRTCGKINKAISKFCTECGTSLSTI
jgi:hypothetical protein